MSVLLDEETVVLEGLDFEVPCKAGDFPAVVAVICRKCGFQTLLCDGHHARCKAILKPTTSIRCRSCKQPGSWSELFEVVPL